MPPIYRSFPRVDPYGPEDLPEEQGRALRLMREQLENLKWSNNSQVEIRYKTPKYDPRSADEVWLDARIDEIVLLGR